MNDKPKRIDPLPEEFRSYEGAGEFWDTHDTTDYPDSFETIDVEAKLTRRRYEVEIDEDLMKTLTEQAQKLGIGVNQLVSEMLKEGIHPAA
jgi:predicted HicB family RNase H-like nuclease